MRRSKSTADVCLLVEDVEQAVTFYSGMLGFAVVQQGSVFARLHAGGFMLSIWQQSTMAAHTGFSVAPACSNERIFVGLPLASPEEVDQLHERLNAGGVRIDVAPRDFPWGARCCFLRDPDGHLWEIYAWRKEMTAVSATL